MSDIDLNTESHLPDIAQAIGVVESKPVLRLIKVAFSLPIFLNKKIQDCYFSYLKRLSSNRIMEKSKSMELSFFDDVRRKYFLDSEVFDENKFQDVMNVATRVSRYTQVLKDLQHYEGCDSSSEDISEHWFDLFDSFFRMRNEPWRMELLNNCLKLESVMPGSTSNRAVMNIAMMEYESFVDLHDFLSLSSKLYINEKFKGFMIVGYHSEIRNRTYTSIDGGLKDVGALITRMESDGTLTLGDACTNVVQADNVLLYIGNSKYRLDVVGLPVDHPERNFLEEKGVEVDDEFINGAQVFGLLLNRVGNQIGKLCTWEMNPVAQEVATQSLGTMGVDCGFQVVLEGNYDLD